MTTALAARTLVPILMYHSIATTTNPRYERFAVAPELLREHLDFLVDNGWTTMTFGQYALARAVPDSLPARLVVLTFDDAFTDFSSVALPMLQERRLAATLFIPTGGVGASSRWMTFERETSRPLLDWSSLREVAESGVECGAHSHTHAQLDRLPPWRLAAEVRRPRDVLEHELQCEVSTFAYPYGYHTAGVRRALAAVGYTAGCGVADLPARASDDRYAIPRLTVPGGTDAAGLARLLAAPRTAAAVLHRRSKAVLWRSARRCGLERAVLRARSR